jgi:hypothetical protein
MYDQSPSTTAITHAELKERSGDLVVKVSASQTWDHGFEP